MLSSKKRERNQQEVVNRKNSIKTWQNEWEETSPQTNLGETFEYHEERKNPIRSGMRKEVTYKEEKSGQLQISPSPILKRKTPRNF